MKWTVFVLLGALGIISCSPTIEKGLRKKDLSRDVEMVTDKGTMIIRLSDSTPLHRNNFLKLVKSQYYNGILFHRVIQHFMIQAGDPKSKKADSATRLGDGDLGYKIPAEFNASLFHHKGVIAAAREGDEANPAKMSSASQFYIVQGRIFTDAGLDSVEVFRLDGQKIPPPQREIYKKLGGAPHLDQSYTVFGEVISGREIIDSIAAVPVNRRLGDRPVKNLRIVKARLVRRK
ncbi:MAG: peptidylprolyl isomerase [Agriterribacter sp.]